MSGKLKKIEKLPFLVRHPLRSAGSLLMAGSEPAEHGLRRLLGLSPAPPNPGGWYFEPVPGGEFFEIKRLTPDEEERQFQEWLHEGRRAELAEHTRRGIHSLGYALERARIRRLAGKLQGRRFERALAAARVIRWHAWHYAPAGEVTHIDGYLELDGERYGFDFSCSGDRAHWDADALRLGSVEIMNRPGEPRSGGCEQPVLPTEVLTPALLETAIRLWYVTRFSEKRGHWALLERRLPRFELDDPWENTALDAKRAKARAQAARKAEQMVLTLLRESEYAAKEFARFGAEPVPAALEESAKRPLADRSAAYAAGKL